MKNNKTKILALALSISFIVSSQTVFANEENTDTENAPSLVSSESSKENDYQDKSLKLELQNNQEEENSQQNVERKVQKQEPSKVQNHKKVEDTDADKKIQSEANVEKISKTVEDTNPKNTENQPENPALKKRAVLKRNPANTANEVVAEFLVEVDQKDYGAGGLVGVDDKLLDKNVGATVYGGAPKDEIKKALEKIEFEVYDENGQLLNTVKPTMGGEGRWSGALNIKGLEKNKKYKIKVKADTIPDGYTYWFTSRTSGKAPEFEINVAKDDVKGTTAVVDPNLVNDKKYGSGRLHLGVFDIIFAKDDETAKNIYKYKEWTGKDGKVHKTILGWNEAYKEGEDYAKTRISKDHEVIKPEGFHKEGYRPLYWYTELPDKSGKYHEFKLDEYYFAGGNPFRQFWNANEENYKDVIKKGKSYIFKLKSELPKVIFNTNDGEDAKDIEQNIYYLKTLNDNNITNGPPIANIVGTPNREGYTFKGWNTKADGSGDDFTGDTKVTDDIKVFAIWEKNKPQPDPEPNPNPTPDPIPNPDPRPGLDDWPDLEPGLDDMDEDDENKPSDEDEEKDKKESEENKDFKENEDKKENKKPSDSKKKDGKADSKKNQNSGQDQVDPSKMKKSQDINALKANPKTGVGTSTGIIASMVAASLGLFATKKKENK